MTSTDTITLQDAFYSLSLEKRMPDADLLEEYVRLYPDYATELTDFAIELALDALRDTEVEDVSEERAGVTSPAVSKAMSRFENRLHETRRESDVQTESKKEQERTGPVENPFERLSRTEIREVTSKLKANGAFVAKLRDRLIDPADMTEGFLKEVAGALNTPTDDVRAHLFAIPSTDRVALQFFRSESKPDHLIRQSFADAVRTSGLTDEQQDFLLGL